MRESVSMEYVDSFVTTYEFPSNRETNSIHEPIILGAGRFATVFEARMKHRVLGVRRVAIKILHAHASYRFINLFDQEIKLLSDMGANHGDGVIVAVDIINIGPLVMCRCGKVFTPQCPEGHGPLITRTPQPNEPFPVLICRDDNDCDVRISAEHIRNDYRKLFKSKQCCSTRDAQYEGAVINFRTCRAIVMDISEHSLDGFLRDEVLPVTRSSALLPVVPAAERVNSQVASLWRFAMAFVSKIIPENSRIGPTDPAKIANDLERARQKTAIIERIRMMIELATTVERLHSSEIVHRDLAPDNIMLKSKADVNNRRIQINAENLEHSKHMLAQKLFQPHFTVCLIDFGLADKKKHSREWYDDEQVDRSRDKMAFWSPEAAHVRLRVSTSDITLFDPNDPRRANGLLGEIRIRPNSTFEFMQGDIIVDRNDTKYSSTIRIEEIRTDGAGSKYAVFSGSLPVDYRNAHLEQIPTLGEPHDLFALGALLYHLFVNDTGLTDAFRTFVLLYSNSGKPVTIDVAAKDGYYILSRDKFSLDYWKDEIMIIAMGAMIRGKVGSCAASRTEFTPAPIRRFLWALRRLHLKMITDVNQELAKLHT